MTTDQREFVIERYSNMQQKWVEMERALGFQEASAQASLSINRYISKPETMSERFVTGFLPIRFRVRHENKVYEILHTKPLNPENFGPFSKTFDAPRVSDDSELGYVPESPAITDSEMETLQSNLERFIQRAIEQALGYAIASEELDIRTVLELNIKATRIWGNAIRLSIATDGYATRNAKTKEVKGK